MNNVSLLIKEFINQDGKKITSLAIIDTELGEKIPIKLVVKSNKEFGFKIHRLKSLIERSNAE